MMKCISDISISGGTMNHQPLFSIPFLASRWEMEFRDFFSRNFGHLSGSFWESPAFCSTLTNQ